MNFFFFSVLATLSPAIHVQRNEHICLIQFGRMGGEVSRQRNDGDVQLGIRTKLLDG